MSALDDDESTPTNSPHFESKSLPSVDDWSHGNIHVPIATRQSDPALLQEDPSEEDIGSILRSKSVPSVTHAPVAQSSYSMLPSKQDGGMEKDDDACLFELSDTEGSVNNGGATDLGGVANTNESVGGRPTNEELVCEKWWMCPCTLCGYHSNQLDCSVGNYHELVQTCGACMYVHTYIQQSDVGWRGCPSSTVLVLACISWLAKLNVACFGPQGRQ